MLMITQAKKGSKPFKLYNTWSDDSSFFEIASTCLSNNFSGTSLLKLNQNLRVVKSLAKQWVAVKRNSTKQAEKARTTLNPSVEALERDLFSVQLKTEASSKRKTLKDIMAKEVYLITSSKEAR